MAMEVAEEVTKGFAVLNDTKTFTDDAFRVLAEFSFDVVLKRKTEDALSTLPLIAKLDAFFVKQAFSAVVSFVLEAAKMNADGLALKGKLEELRVPEARRQLFEQLYVVNKEPLRKLLALSGFHLPHVVGVDWRLDYELKSNRLERVDVPVYSVTLHTEMDGKKGSVQFACSLDELQDLVSKLRSAVKQIDRILNA